MLIRSDWPRLALPTSAQHMAYTPMIAMTSPDRQADGFLKGRVHPLRYDGHNSADPVEATGILRSFLPNGVRVLDVGCGTGSMTKVITQGKSSQVLGIEPDQTRAELAKSRGIDVFCGTLTEEYFKNRELFDVVIFADVLEHVADPASLLKLAARGLTTSGIVLISVPNAAHWSMRLHLMRGRFDYTETGIRDATHLRWFTLRTIQDILRNEGFEILTYRPTAGIWMAEYNYGRPWKWMPSSFRQFLISVLAQAAPTLFACQYVVKARFRNS